MSLQHIPKCVWWPLGALISSLTVFLFVLTIMLYKAKQVEIQMAQVGIVVEYADSYATQLVQIADSLNLAISQLENQNKADTSPAIDYSDVNKNKPQSPQYSNTIPMPTASMLQEKKQQIEMINHGLQSLKKKLPKDFINN